MTRPDITSAAAAAGGGAVVNRLRPRRSCLAVPGSSARFLGKAQGLPAVVAGKGRAAGMARTTSFQPPG